MYTNKIVIEQTRDLIDLKFVATDFSPKIISLKRGIRNIDTCLCLLFSFLKVLSSRLDSAVKHCSTPVLAKNLLTQRSRCYSAVSALFINLLPDRSKYSPLCHTNYLTLDLVCSGQTLYQAASWRLILQSSLIKSVPFCLFSLYLYPLSAPFLNPLSSPSPHLFFLF